MTKELEDGLFEALAGPVINTLRAYDGQGPNNSVDYATGKLIEDKYYGNGDGHVNAADSINPISHDIPKAVDIDLGKLEEGMRTAVAAYVSSFDTDGKKGLSTVEKNALAEDITARAEKFTTMDGLMLLTMAKENNPNPDPSNPKIDITTDSLVAEFDNTLKAPLPTPAAPPARGGGVDRT